MSKNLILKVLAFILATGGTFGAYKVIENNTYTVLRVIDGDTIVIQIKKNKEQKVRLLGVDAPERGECHYSESKNLLRELIAGSEVELERERTGEDAYGRWLRHVVLPPTSETGDATHINNELILEGAAWRFIISPDTKYSDLFATSEEKAREASTGLWGSGCEYSQELEDARSLRERASTPPDPECTIKGNISEKAYGKLYFLEGCPNYKNIKIDERKGESWFCTEADAKSAGFTKSDSCNNTFR